MSDGRLHPRLRLNVIADMIGSEVVLGRPVDDISMGGARFAGPAWEPEDAPVKLVLAFPDSGAAVAVEGRIVRASPSDMGVRFIDMSDEQKWALRKHVREAQGR
ncbi:PilZ domain-containing protein [Nannocystaceae bacterium ST9]